MAWKTMFKESATKRKIKKHEDRAVIDLRERQNKATVRRRDKTCRFPECGCKRLRLKCEVGHQVHKQSGGDKLGNRSEPDNMLLLCRHRHRDGTVSRHHGTMRAITLTSAGTNGPVAWEVDLNAMGANLNPESKWFEVARERAPGIVLPVTLAQAKVLAMLSTMEF